MNQSPNQSTADTLPLAGVRVLDVTANMSGPFSTMILGDQGADVIKLEPLAGDPLRNIGTGSESMSGYFANLNRSKRFLAVDLTSDDGRPVLDALLDWCDVVVHNYRPTAAERLGIDAERVRGPGRERLIHVAIGGFGPTGPMADRPAYDQVIQALSGFAARQAGSDGEPRLVRQGIIDKLTGMATAQAITSALVAQVRSGVGRSIRISMLDVAVSVLWPDGMMNHTIESPERSLPDISNSFRLFQTSDGHVSFSLVHSKQLGNLRRAIAREGETVEDANPPMSQAGTIFRATAERLTEMTTDEAVRTLSDHDVPVAPVVELDDLHEHPQIIANETIGSFEHPVLGPVRQANPMVRFDGTTVADLRTSAPVGADGREVLAELGFDAPTIDRLVRDGVVAGDAAAGSG